MCYVGFIKLLYILNVLKILFSIKNDVNNLIYEIVSIIQTLKKRILVQDTSDIQMVKLILVFILHSVE